MIDQHDVVSRSLMTRVLAYPRSLLWAAAAIVTTIFFGTFGVLIALFLPYRLRYRWFNVWSFLLVWYARFFCGVAWKIEGKDNIPDSPCVVLSKHQSAWETLMLQSLFVPQTWVLKRQLMFIPLLGWALRLLDPIAIDRENPRQSMREIIKQGSLKLKQGRWVVIFPEGTRVSPGQTTRFRRGGVVLASQTSAQITPVAHNAGEFWPKNSFLKYPGLITLRIGKPIPTKNRDPDELLASVQDWINFNTEDISLLAKNIKKNNSLA